MTEEQWDAAEYAIEQAKLAWQQALESVLDDMAHHAARNRIVMTLDALEDAATYGQRARTLVEQARA